LVAFWIDELKHCRSLRTVRDKLKHLPTSLNAMYTSMVSKITADDLQYAQAIMPWLLFSVGPLKLEQIAAVAWFGFSDGRPAFDKDRGFAHPKAVLDVFGGLVVMSDGTAFFLYNTRHFLIRATDGVTLAHLTIKEFLLEQESALHVNEPDAHSFIARCCLTYLLDQFPPRVAAGVQGFPLHDYAVTNWMHHASSTRDIEDTQSVLYDLALQVLHPKHETFQRWSCVWHPWAYREVNIYPTPLFVSARWGFQNLTARLLVLGVGVTRSKSGSTALHLASKHGHLEVVKMLLDGPNITINPAVVGADEPLHIVELADVNAKNPYSETPLTLACHSGHMNVVELLLQKGADINPQGEDSHTPFHSACSGGHIKIVQLLLEKGADVNPQGKHLDTPLRSACSRGHIKIIQLLLEKGADINPQGMHSDTPLRSACSWVTSRLSSYSLRREQT
jgi:ankyrin repeat protein